MTYEEKVRSLMRRGWEMKLGHWYLPTPSAIPGVTVTVLINEPFSFDAACKEEGLE